MKKLKKISSFFFLTFFTTFSFCFSQHPLIQAMVAYEHPKYLDADKMPLIDTIKKYGPDAPVDKLNATLLHYAANNGYIKTMQILFEQKAQVDVRDCKGNTPLHDAVFMQNILVINLLLSYHADPLLANYHGITPMHLTSHNKKIEKILYEKIATTKTLNEKLHASL